MKLIGAGFRDRVDNATRGTSVLSSEVRSVDLKLANRRLANRLGAASASSLFREKALVVVAAVYGAVIQQP